MKFGPELYEALEAVLPYAQSAAHREAAQLAAMEIQEAPIADAVRKAEKALSLVRGGWMEDGWTKKGEEWLLAKGNRVT